MVLPRVVLLPALALALSACVAPGARLEPVPTGGLQPPTFEPLPPDARGTEGSQAGTPTASATPATPPAPSDGPSPATPDPEGTTTSSPAPTNPPSGSGASEPRRGVLEDGTGDLDGLGANRAPAHADLRRVTLELTDTEGRIVVEFAGPAPENGEGDEIVNVATYHDVTGDGAVDYEIWASLTVDGWGTAWYDIRNGTARFASEDDVAVDVVEGTLVLTFPSSHLGDATSGQWLASSEWGTPLTIGTSTAVTDDAPDDRAGRAWPS